MKSKETLNILTRKHNYDRVSNDLKILIKVRMNFENYDSFQYDHDIICK
jgi:hypothetical protein